MERGYAGIRPGRRAGMDDGTPGDKLWRGDRRLETFVGHRGRRTYGVLMAGALAYLAWRLAFGTVRSPWSGGRQRW